MTPDETPANEPAPTPAFEYAEPSVTATEATTARPSSSGSQGKTVALIASVAAVAGLAGGFAIRSSTHSTATQVPTNARGTFGQFGPSANPNPNPNPSQNQNDDDTQGGFSRDGGAVPAPFRGGGPGSTQSRGS